MTTRPGFLDDVSARWSGELKDPREASPGQFVFQVSERIAPGFARWLVVEKEFRFAGMMVRELAEAWKAHYLFCSRSTAGLWAQFTISSPISQPTFPSLSAVVHAADWHEREAEDHFGVSFEGHPRLGDFVLHDEDWQEGVAPMRRSFDPGKAQQDRAPKKDWHPRRILHSPGAFAMSVGPIYGGISEPVHFLLETQGEDVVRAYPRLFFKYRAVEKLAEGQAVEDALLLAERFNAQQAFAHSFAFCQAVEKVFRIAVPARAQVLRLCLAELERLRSHVTTIRAICGSTALAVAESQAAILEEDLLRTSGTLFNHRYLFGLNVPGGLSRNLEDPEALVLASATRRVARSLEDLKRRLFRTSSFLDRLEDVGLIRGKQAIEHGLVGPVARASGLPGDMRSAQPYGGSEQLRFDEALEEEGDGYARLRVLFLEAGQSARLVDQLTIRLPAGAVRNGSTGREASGESFGWVEAAGGAALHWIFVNEKGMIDRYRIIPPSFINWHGFHLAAENFAFQDFPIIMATMGLSVAENDR